MDAVQKVKDLMRLALDERTPENERTTAAFGALRLIDRYNLLSSKRVDVAANIIEKFTNPDFVEGVAVRVEKVASVVERIMGSAKKVAGAAGARENGGGRPRRRRRYE